MITFLPFGITIIVIFSLIGHCHKEGETVENITVINTPTTQPAQPSLYPSMPNIYAANRPPEYMLRVGVSVQHIPFDCPGLDTPL